MVADVAGSPVVLGYTAIHLLAIGTTVSVAVYTVQNYWNKPLGRVFAGLLGTVTTWAAGSLGRLFTQTVDLFMLVTLFKYVGIAWAPVLFVLFALLYDGKPQWITRPVIIAISVVPAITLPIVATTQLHGLFYGSYAMADVGAVSVLSIETVGPWYWLFVVYGWTLFTVGSGLLVHAGIQRSRFYRVQLLVVIPAIAISWIANIVYVLWSWPHPALDPTPIGFAMTSLLLGFGLFSTQFVEVSPAARSLVFDVIDDAVLVVDQADRVIDLNSAAEPLLSDPNPVGSDLTGVLVADLAQQIEADADTVELTDEPTSRHYRYRELSQPDELEGRVLVFTEITSLTESQRATEQAHEQLRQIIDLVPDPLYVKNLDDEVLLSNEANAALHGMTPEEMEETRERDIEPDVENIEEFEPYRQRELEVIETGDSMTVEEELTDPDGERHVFRTTRLPFEATGRDEDAVLGYARDVTALKEYEQKLEQSHERIERTNRELETLNRILRHDIRNDVVVMSRLGDELEQHVDEDGQELLAQLLERGEHIKNLTTGLRDLMRTLLEEDREHRPVPVDAILESEIRDVTQSYDDATVTMEDVPRVHVRANQMLSSVFRNILENAIRHNDREVPEVEVSVQERTDRVEVRIGDNGPGVPEDIRADIFGRGEKGLESKGTGIGLYLVSQLVAEYGGEVWVEDNDPKGAVFVVELAKQSPEDRHAPEQ
jgi:PAS domain S-box-containing protein